MCPYLFGGGLLLHGGRGGLGPIGVHGLLLQFTIQISDFKYSTPSKKVKARA